MKKKLFRQHQKPLKSQLALDLFLKLISKSLIHDK